MSFLSEPTIRKFIREAISETEKPIKVPLKQQDAWLEKLAKRLQKISEVSTHTRTDDAFIDLWVASVGTYTDHGFIRIGFPKNKTGLVVASMRYYADGENTEALIGDLDEIDELISIMKKRLAQRQLKKKQRGTTAKFTLQGLKANLTTLCTRHGLDFYISKKQYYYYIYLRKSGKGLSTNLVVRINGSKNKAETEFAKLPTYIKHAAEHFEFAEVVQGVGGKRLPSIGYSANWVNCGKENK